MSNFDATRGGFGYESPVEGASNDWWTPPHYVEALGTFDLDPCAGVGQKPLATNVITLPDDGLKADWGNARVWCNPPYGPHTIDWIRKMNMHGNGIMLIFARIETKAWRIIWETADAILFPFGRITFELPSGQKAKSGTAPSAFVAWGDNNASALSLCSIEGAYVENVEIIYNAPMSFCEEKVPCS